MYDSSLCENIRKKLEAEGVSLSENEFQELCTSVFSSMSEILDNGDILDISNFGSLWRKMKENSSTTFFKPTEGIIERINKQI